MSDDDNPYWTVPVDERGEPVGDPVIACSEEHMVFYELAQDRKRGLVVE